jgi:hypothetical protein
MFLTQHNVIHYLLERGYVSTKAVVHDHCRVNNASSRNRCFRVSFATHPGVFVKQARDNEPWIRTCLEIEAECYAAFCGKNSAAELSEHIAAICGYDRIRSILCCELISKAQSLRAVQINRPELRAALATKLGESLAKFHSRDAAGVIEKLPATARHRVPSLLLYGSQGIGSQNDPAGISVRMSEYPEYVKLVREVASLWHPNGLMHGDIRWDNFLVSEAGPDLGLFIVDWELAGGGDVAWDVAGVMQSYLIEWSADMLGTHEMQSLIGRFWSSYVARRGLPATEAADFVRRMVVYAGCRLIQSTFEQHQFGAPLGTAGLKLLQLSWNVLSDPATAERDLLALHQN